jgi:hypothetical protein
MLLLATSGLALSNQLSFCLLWAKRCSAIVNLSFLVMCGSPLSMVEIFSMRLLARNGINRSVPLDFFLSDSSIQKIEL